MKIFVILLIILEISKANGQLLFYKYVDCYYTPDGYTACYDANPQIVSIPPRTQQNGFGHTEHVFRSNRYPQTDANPQIVSTPRRTQQNGFGHTEHVFRSNQDPQTAPRPSFARSHETAPCTDNQFTCTSPYQCIDRSKVCDGLVDCVDGTDEKDCSCVSKLEPKKFCDNYVDCPDGSDEIACNGCASHLKSCFSGIENECYSKTQECDWINNCSNGEDEKDCSMLSPKVNLPPNPFLRSTEGFLFRNYQNVWYPVCNDYSNLYSLRVCEQELGVRSSVESLLIKHVPTNYNGQYLSRKNDDTYQFHNTCSQKDGDSTNHFVHVTCPKLCGVIPASTIQARIAGGKNASPQSHPWMAGLYLNGTFVCAGSIFLDRWIIAAAHCVYHNNKRLTQRDYVEVRVGFLRQHSFSPNEQISKVFRIVIHQNYNATKYRNDIALLELSDALIFNRWVKPICLPSMKNLGDGTDPNWMWRPDINTFCSTAGWGASTARGPVPVENLVELDLPILAKCVPENANVTCAGYPNGGFDACAGDSGGPLECGTGTSQNEVYLAGITSAGYNSAKEEQNEVFCGEPNTVTAFTRTSFYIDWIYETMYDSPKKGDIYPSQMCPGVICRTNNRCAKFYDGIVDCMHGEDELKIS